MSTPTPHNHPIVIIGAGPSGSVSAALLHAKGHPVLILEKSQFPRFSIGESLLPQCMAFIEEAGMMDAVEAAVEEAGLGSCSATSTPSKVLAKQPPTDKFCNTNPRF